jgi:tetratricopeptide (TPR) repeat protein
MNPQDADAYANRAAANIKSDRLEDAVYDLEQAIKNNPAHIHALRGLATLLSMDSNEKIRDGQRAVEVALRLVSLERTWENLEILAAAHAEARQFPQAIAAQEKALEQARAEEAGTSMLEANLKRYQREKKYR